MVTIEWCGRTWIIAAGDSYKHPGYVWNPNIPIDSNGYLHLNLEKINGIWYAPMIYDATPTGYGTYEWVLQGIHALDKDAVLGLFPYAWNHAHELDIEQAQWGAATNPTWDFAVQPSTETGKKAIVEFSLAMPNPNDIYCTIFWTPTGETFSMRDQTGRVLKEWSSSIPVNALLPDPARAFINLYPRTVPNTGWTQSVPPATDQHYVIKSFTFTPLGAADTYYDTFLVAALSKEQIRAGESVTISGSLTTIKSALRGMQITFVADNGDVIPPTVTDSNGNFSVAYTPSTTGDVTVTAYYAGTA